MRNLTCKGMGAVSPNGSSTCDLNITTSLPCLSFTEETTINCIFQCQNEHWLLTITVFIQILIDAHALIDPHPFISKLLAQKTG